MINNDRTLEFFGYNIEDISLKSHKKIVINCDYCKNEMLVTKKNHLKRVRPERDACKNCSGLKRKELKYKNLMVEMNPIINEERTYEKFGYYSNNLTSSSNKPVIVNCDYCNVEVQKTKRAATHFIGILKTACKKCCGKKMTEGSYLKDYTEANEKRRLSCQEKYGYDFFTQVPELKDKIKETNLKNLGVEYPTQSKEILRKREKTCIQRYGFAHSQQNEEVKNKTRKTNLERYGETSYAKTQKFKTWFTKYLIETGQKKLYQGKTMQEWADELGKAYTTIQTEVLKYGFEIAVQLSKKTSSLEIKVQNLLKELNTEYIEQFKVESKLADFFISSSNLIIECDGNFWHSDCILKNKNYHYHKKSLYSKFGYQSLFFREDEINNSPEIVKSMILNKLGQCTKIFARKCEIKEVSKKEAKAFLKINHLMGPGRGNSFGLFLNDSLSCLIQVINKREELHISRFCNVLNTTVVGGYSRLLKHIENLYKPQVIINFVDGRYGTGIHLKSLGFILERHALSFKWTNGRDTWNRMKFPCNDGYEKKLYKLWDCGQLKYVKRRIIS